MGNYENIVKLEEIRRKADEGDYITAQKILDTMKIKKIKNPSDLSALAEVFIQNGRYEEAMEQLLKIYQKARTRKTLFQIIEICLKQSNIADAEKYLKEYIQIAPKDFYKYIFRYMIDKLKKEPFEKQIETLENLKQVEYMEHWAYELAKLYYKAGMEKECINECSDLILWFGEGVYVEKAKMLKAYYSGETNKDQILEELKRRSMEIKEKPSTGEVEADTHPEGDKKETDMYQYALKEEVDSNPASVMEEADPYTSDIMEETETHPSDAKEEA